MTEPLKWDDIDGRLVPIESLTPSPKPSSPPRRISKYEDFIDALAGAMFLTISAPKPVSAYPPVANHSHSMSMLSREDILQSMRDLRDAAPRVPRFTHVYGSRFAQVNGDPCVYLIDANALSNRIPDIDFDTPVQWDSDSDLIRYRDAYSFAPRLSPMISVADSGDGYIAPDPAGWRRYGTKQRPVRANKRRRLARRFPLPNCRDRQKRKRRWRDCLKRNPIPK